MRVGCEVGSKTEEPQGCVVTSRLPDSCPPNTIKYHLHSLLLGLQITLVLMGGVVLEL